MLERSLTAPPTDRGTDYTGALPGWIPIDLFRRDAFDLLITDLGLPDGSGHDLIGRLRAIRPIKGIVLSGYGMDSDVARSRTAGFAEHLTKPVQIALLLAAIDRTGAEPA